MSSIHPRLPKLNGDSEHAAFKRPTPEFAESVSGRLHRLEAAGLNLMQAQQASGEFDQPPRSDATRQQSTAIGMLARSAVETAPSPGVIDISAARAAAAEAYQPAPDEREEAA